MQHKSDEMRNFLGHAAGFVQSGRVLLAASHLVAVFRNGTCSRPSAAGTGGRGSGAGVVFSETGFAFVFALIPPFFGFVRYFHGLLCVIGLFCACNAAVRPGAAVFNSMIWRGVRQNADRRMRRTPSYPR